MTLEEAKDYLYATLKVLTKNTDEEIRAYIEMLETESPKMTIAELEKEIAKLKGENNGKKKIMNNQEIGHCKDCDKWKKGKRGNNEDWYSDEGFCNNWRAMTGEDFYCADFEVKELKGENNE